MSLTDIDDEKTEEIEQHYEDRLRSYRPRAIQAAKDLRYGESVVKQIKEAETTDEISRIMGNARRRRSAVM